MRLSHLGRRGTRLVLAALALLLSPALVSAQATFNWNAANGAYYTPGNWSPSGPPAMGSHIVIDNNGTAQFTSGQEYLTSITLGATAGKSGTLAVTGGLIDMFPGGIRVGEVGTGVVTIDNATMSTGDGSIYVGGQFSTGTGTLTLSGNTSILSSTDNFSIGRQGTGTFNFNGGYATSDYATIGKFGTGVWNQTGGVFVQTAGDFEVGDGGTYDQRGTSGPRSGTLNLSGGVIQTSGFFAISNRRATGTVNVSGGAIAATGVVNNGAIIIGRGMGWDNVPGGAAGTGGPTTMRVTGDDAVIIANGDFEMNVFDIASSATLIAAITGPNHTPIKVTGNARIDNGTFKVELGGYAPVLGDQWTILSAGVADLSAEKAMIDNMLTSMGQSPLTHKTDGVAVGTLQGEFKATDFASAPLSAGLQWDVAYESNSVILKVIGSAPAFTADFNDDNRVDAADLAAWKLAFGPGAGADANGDNVSDGADFLAWQRQFGSGVPATSAVDAVPEPASIALCGLAAAALALRVRSRRAQAFGERHGSPGLRPGRRRPFQWASSCVVQSPGGAGG